MTSIAGYDTQPKSRAATVLAVAVSAALLAAAFPYPTGVHNSRGKHICASNLKMLGVAIAQYTQDYDERMPSGIRFFTSANLRGDAGLGSVGQIYSYVKDVNEYSCPDNQTSYMLASYPRISYGYNRSLSNNVTNAAFDNPSCTVALFEVTGAHAPVDTWPSPTLVQTGPLSPVGDGTQQGITDGSSDDSCRVAAGDIGSRKVKNAKPPRHHGGANYLLADGHVKWFAPHSVSSGSDALHATDQQTGTTTGRAAGTGNRLFQATFSIK